MHTYLSKETIAKIREKVRSGESRCQVAREFGITPPTVFYHTEDLPKSNRGRRLSLEEKENIFALLDSGKTKAEVTRITGISYLTILSMTGNTKPANDLKFKFMQEMMSKGFIIPKNGTEKAAYKQIFRSIKGSTPVRKAFISGKRTGWNQKRSKTIYFLEDKKNVAFQAYLSIVGHKLANYSVLSRLADSFGVSLSSRERKEIYAGRKTNVKNGKSENNDSHKRSATGSQTQISDFIGNFLHCHQL
jgi:hypothetical protein